MSANHVAYLKAHSSKRDLIAALTNNKDVLNLTNEEARTLAEILSREVGLFIERA